ncbi:MAG: hypothetical protein KJO07_15090 [Deltaproteobacteria bacterium]|nr:hypothetical protein [Deltaproteobacteria bacterium]
MTDEPNSEPDAEPALAPAWLIEPLRGPLSKLARYELWIVIGLCAAVLIPGIWSYTLVDPWETHYAEVARRMLQDSDWVQMRWQNENFDSKPVLTFWLMAAGMKAMGLANAGGYSGELTSSGLTMFAIRIPFVLFGVFGLAMTWWMLAKLVSRRVAWLSLLIIGTSPFYFLVARQGITDMPMVGCLMGSVACIAMVVSQRDGPLEPVFGRLNAFHLFLAFLVLFVGGQLLYFAVHFSQNPEMAPGLRGVQPLAVLVVPFGLLLAGFALAGTLWRPLAVSRRHTVFILWLFALMGISILGKGPPAAAITVFIAVFYVLLARRWDLIKSKELWIDIARGTVVMILVAVPWHVAIFFKQGLRWINVYLRTHIMQRAFKGVHGDRGTFEYYVSQLGIGMWPWAALLPGALATVLVARMAKTTESSVRLLVGTWAIVGFALFAAVQTKFHHYILPVVPALGILIAFFLDDMLRGKLKRSLVFTILASAIVLVILRDLVFEQKQLIELFVYRHDRAWPEGDPWYVDISRPLIAFGACFAVLFVALSSQRLRRLTVPALTAVAVAFAVWAGNGYMNAAGPHWGQRALHQTYYAQRTIHGVEVEYYSLRDLYDDWNGKRTTVVRSVLPKSFATGQPAKVTIRVPGAGIPKDRVVMEGKVSAIGDDRFTIEVADSEHAKLGVLLERGKAGNPSRRRPVSQVDADRLIAWQLNWRGENFWSGGEIWGPFAETHTVFVKTDNVEFTAYMKELAVEGRRYFVITEAQRARNLKPILPTANAKKSFEILDRSNNKFTLVSFTL